MKIIKISLLSILLWSCAQQVNLYPEGVTKELFTISVPDERVPLELPTIASNQYGIEIILLIKFNRSLDEFEKRLNPKKIRYALHITKVVEGVHFHDIPISIFNLTDSVNTTILYVQQPYIISNKPNQNWAIKPIREGSIIFYYQCTYTDVNNKRYEGVVSNKLVVPARFY